MKLAAYSISPRASASGLPCSLTMIAARSSRCARIRSNQRRSSCARAFAVWLRQPAKAACAASIAASTSAGLQRGASPTRSPHAGLLTAKRAPAAASRQSPPISACWRKRVGSVSCMAADSSCSVLQVGLRLDAQLDLVADERQAGAHAERGALEGGGGVGAARALLGGEVEPALEAGDLQPQRLRDAQHRQFAFYRHRLALLEDEALAAESEGGIAADVEPVGPLEDGVALVVAGVDRTGVDDDFEAAGVLHGVVFEGAARAVELAALGGKAEMVDFEQRKGVRGVELVRRGPCRGAGQRGEEDGQVRDSRHGHGVE